MPLHVRSAHNIMITGNAGIVALLLLESAAAPKLLSSLFLSSHPLIYQLPKAVVNRTPGWALFQPMTLLDGSFCHLSPMGLQPHPFSR